MLYEVSLFGIALNCCNDWPMWGICPNFASDMQEREKKIYRVTLVGSVVNALLVVFKFIAGFLGHSSAMVADAVHSLSAPSVAQPTNATSHSARTTNSASTIFATTWR